MTPLAERFSARTVPSSAFPELATLLARIESTYAPQEIFLYGSRARRQATQDSDWDIKVVVPDDAPVALLDPMLGWHVQEGSGVYADVSCAKASEFSADLNLANTAAWEIAHGGLRIQT